MGSKLVLKKKKEKEKTHILQIQRGGGSRHHTHSRPRREIGGETSGSQHEDAGHQT